MILHRPFRPLVAPVVIDNDCFYTWLKKNGVILNRKLNKNFEPLQTYAVTKTFENFEETQILEGIRYF